MGGEGYIEYEHHDIFKNPLKSRDTNVKASQINYTQ